MSNFTDVSFLNTVFGNEKGNLEIEKMNHILLDPKKCNVCMVGNILKCYLQHEVKEKAVD